MVESALIQCRFNVVCLQANVHLRNVEAAEEVNRAGMTSL